MEADEASASQLLTNTSQHSPKARKDPRTKVAQPAFCKKPGGKILVRNSRQATPEALSPETSRFEGATHEMSVLQEITKRLDAESAAYRAKEERPVEKYYGGAHEIMQYVSKYEQKHAPEKGYDALLRDLRTGALPLFSMEETGQKAVDETFDEERLARTPDSQGRRLPAGEQPASSRQRAATFDKIRSDDVKQQCLALSAQLSRRELDSRDLTTKRSNLSKQFVPATASSPNFDSGSGGEGRTAQTGTDGKLTKAKSRRRSPRRRKAGVADYEKEAAARQRLLAKTQKVNVEDVLRGFVIPGKLHEEKEAEGGRGYIAKMIKQKQVRDSQHNSEQSREGSAREPVRTEETDQERYHAVHQDQLQAQADGATAKKTRFKSGVAQDLKGGRLNLEDYKPYNMAARFKKAGFVDPIFGIESLRDTSMVDYYCNKFVLQGNHISPTITQEDVDREKTDPFKSLSKVMRKREAEHTERTRVSMHFYAVEELAKRKAKRQ